MILLHDEKKNIIMCVHACKYMYVHVHLHICTCVYIYGACIHVHGVYVWLHNIIIPIVLYMSGTCIYTSWECGQYSLCKHRECSQKHKATVIHNHAGIMCMDDVNVNKEEINNTSLCTPTESLDIHAYWGKHQEKAFCCLKNIKSDPHDHIYHGRSVKHHE